MTDMFRNLTLFKILASALFLSSCWVNGVASAQGNRVEEQKNKVEDLINEGRQLMDTGELESAFNNFVIAKSYSSSLGFKELEFVSTIELANFYLLKGEPEESEELFTSIKLQENYQPKTICRYYHRMAFYYNQVGKEDSAKIYCQQALNYAEEFKINEAKGIIYNELGDLYEQSLDYDSSLYYFDKARRAFDISSYDHANASYNLSRIQYHLGFYDSVIVNLENLMARIEDTEWYFIKSPSYSYLAYSYSYLGDSLTGLKNRELSLRAELAVSKQNHNENLENLKISYETEKKNQEIEKHKSDLSKEKAEKEELFILISFLGILLFLLVLSFFIIRNKNTRLNKLVKENEFLVGESNHRIKNNLQIIVSLVSREIYKNESEDISALQSIQSKIESIATLHQQLYINEEKSQINLSDYLKSVIDNLLPICQSKGIMLNLKAEDLLLYNVSKSIYVGLLCNELIINSIKHAFEGEFKSPEIRIELSMNEDKINLIYTDNGKGLQSDVRPKLIDMMCRQLKTKYQLAGNEGFKFKVKL